MNVKQRDKTRKDRRETMRGLASDPPPVTLSTDTSDATETLAYDEPQACAAYRILYFFRAE